MKHNRNNEHKHEIHQHRNLNQQTDEKAKRVEAKEAKEAKWVQTRTNFTFQILVSIFNYLSVTMVSNRKAASVKFPQQNHQTFNSC